MNIQQIKTAIKKFRSADVSVIKDDALRAKAQKLQGKQGGFTLLELLVVITLLATLATAALVAYDGVGENASAAAAANTAGTLDQGVRAYRAITQAYPNQWDNLSDPAAVGPAAGEDFIPAKLQEILGSVNILTAMTNAGVVANADGLQDYFEDKFGMDEIQHITALEPGLAPNRQHNEGANPGALETDIGKGYTHISILASQANRADTGLPLNCQVGGQSITATWSNGTLGTPGVANPNVINSINDGLSTERCNLVLALGFGGDAAQSTVDAAAGVIQAPAYSSKNVNPSEQYARYVGLFHLAKGDKARAEGDTGDTFSNLVASNFLARPRLLGFIDTEGNTIDANIASANIQ